MRARFLPLPTIMILLLLPGMTAAGASNEIVRWEGDSNYHHIRVIDHLDRGIRRMAFDVSWESKQLIHDPYSGFFEYTDFYHLSHLYKKDIKKALLIGLGGASIPKSFEKYFPDVELTVVEIDPLVVDVAKQWFSLKERDNLKIVVMDGRVFLNKTQQKFDLVMFDAFTYHKRWGSTTPFHLATLECFREVARVLNPGGVVQYNLIGQIKGHRASVIGSVYKTAGAAFPTVDLYYAQSSQNVVLTACKANLGMGRLQLQTKAQELYDEGVFNLPGLKQRAGQVWSRRIDTSRHKVLTDDYAPIDNLLK